MLQSIFFSSVVFLLSFFIFFGGGGGFFEFLVQPLRFKKAQLFSLYACAYVSHRNFIVTEKQDAEWGRKMERTERKRQRDKAQSWKDWEQLTGLYRCMTVAKASQITVRTDE